MKCCSKWLCFIANIGALALAFSWLIIFYRIWQDGGRLLVEPNRFIFWAEVSSCLVFILVGSINIWRLGGK